MKTEGPQGSPRVRIHVCALPCPYSPLLNVPSAATLLPPMPAAPPPLFPYHRLPHAATSSPGILTLRVCSKSFQIYSPALSGGVDSRPRAACFAATSLPRGLASSQLSLPSICAHTVVQTHTQQHVSLHMSTQMQPRRMHAQAHTRHHAVAPILHA